MWLRQIRHNVKYGTIQLGLPHLLRADFEKDDVYPADTHFYFEICMLVPVEHSWLKLLESR